MSAQTLDPPGLSPGSGSYTSSVTVTLSSTQSGATIRYTTNGTTPTASSTVYSSPLVITTTTTLKAKAFHPDFTTSPEASAAYSLTAATPTLSVAGGAYAPGSDVTIATTEATATLRMTLDGTDPTSSSVTVASGTSLLLGNFTLKVRAFRTGATDSAVASTSYTLTGPLGPGSVASGTSHSVLATTDGRVFAWGVNSSSQIGDGTTTARTTPVLVPGVTGITTVAAGMAHTFAVTADGRLYAWGSNGSGRLGDGTTTPRPTPIVVPGLTTLVTVAAGDQHTLALLSTGRVWAWGENGSGQLGLGTTTDMSTPTEIPDLANVVAIAAGSAHSLAVTASGQLYAWGLNTNARLGDGTTTTRTSPVLIDLSDVVSVAAGYAHSLALTSSGAIYSWGAGSNGQLGRGTIGGATTPTVIPSVFASEIAAGDFFSAALRHDGVYLAWGANGAGQLGDSTTTQQLSPVIVTGPIGVSRVALGGAHSLAATAGGELWSWGSGSSGKLGDGTTTNRPTPQAVITDLEAWYPAAPALTLPSGTLSTASIVTVTSPTGGAILRYTTNGTEPTAGSPEVPANGQVWITDASFFRARAFVSGRSPGAIARANYELPAATPVITPATGTYTSAQTVTMTASGAPASIRYTTDGSEPSETSTLYAGSFVVSTSTTIRATAYPSNGWSASPSATATLAFNYGTVNPPAASPVSGVFPQPPQVTLSADAGTTIRYTLDGSIPTETSTLYTGPITVPAGATLRARAFRVDWTSSAVMSEVYAADDMVPPTIAARRLPSPINTWHLTPVTISFTCADNVALASCSAPVTVSTEGAGLLVSGTAVDSVGLQASLVETVNLDLTPPAVTLTSPADGLVTSTTTVQLTGTAADGLSGLVAVSCNGEAASVVDGQVSCSVSLRPGLNALTLTARDAAGNSTSAGVTVTRAGTANQITLTPSTRTMLVGEDGLLSLRDNFGMPVGGALWSSSDPAIVVVSSDDPPVLAALAAGDVTITAEKDGLNSTATITVVAGATLAEGTTRWTVPPTPSSGGMRQDPPIYTHRADATVPDLFSVEKNVTTEEHTVRALSSSGEVQWTMIAPGVPLMGDAFGGLVAGVDKPGVPCRAVYGEFEFCYTALARFAGPAGTTVWRYDTAGYIDRPAQGPDGTIYLVEHLVGAQSYEKTIVMLNGATGQVTARVPLKNRITDIRVVNGSCQSSYGEQEPQSVGPIVAGDGFGYLLVTNRTWNGVWNCGAQEYESSTDDVGLDLLRLSKDGLLATEVIRECTNCGGEPTPRQLLPDGIGGLLVVSESWNGTTTVKTVTRLDGSGGRADTPIQLGTRIELIGQDGAAYLNRVSGINNSVEKKVVDVRNFTTRYTVPPEWSWLAASPDGGARAEGTDGQLATFDGTGQLIGTSPSVDITSPVHEFGDLVGRNFLTGVRAVAMPFKDATRWDASYRPASPSTEEPKFYGSRFGDFQTLKPGTGIHVKVHNVAGVFPQRHLAIWVAKAAVDNPSSAYSGSDEYGNKVLTIGAAASGFPVDPCGGNLVSDLNRSIDNDRANALFIEKLPYMTADEDLLIAQLRARDQAYGDGYPYACNPENTPGHYNSNSFAVGLLNVVGLPNPQTPFRAPPTYIQSVYPGMLTPLPASAFQ